MKLVRDKIPEIAKERKFKTVSELNLIYSEVLKQKLIEEVDEYLEAKTKEEKTEELADILEVLYAILDDEKIYLDELEELRLKKFNEHGGFEKQMMMM